MTQFMAMRYETTWDKTLQYNTLQQTTVLAILILLFLFSYQRLLVRT